MAAVLIMSTKLATLGLLKIEVFWDKDYDVIIPAHEVINKILSRKGNYFVNVVMWSKFGNCGIFTRKVIITPILQGFD